ncbi:MAG: Si-specific NAD(P)(+) transhydrogenase [Planctomycetota bacterium]
MEKFDLAVIGTGPAGHFGAIQAAKAGRSVVAIEATGSVGGAAVFGTIPAKALREATLHLMGLRQRTHYGAHYRVKRDLSIRDLTRSTEQIICMERDVLEEQLRRNGVKIVHGFASFVSPHQVVTEGPDGVRVFEVDRVLVAVGTVPARPPGIDFDGTRIIDSNQILQLERIPQRLTVIGAGVIGIEYACMFAALGTQVTLVNQSDRFLDFVDRQVLEVLCYHMQANNVRFRLGETISDMEKCDSGVLLRTASGKTIAGDCVLYAVGRQGNTEFLNLEAAGLEADKRGRIAVNDDYQCAVPHIYAAGDVIGFPALAATSREQGRRAICHAFGLECVGGSEDLPYGIYSIPEISMIGPTEQELTAKGTPYEVGLAWYREIARGHLLGDVSGLLKLLFDPDTKKLHAVHAVGDGATELVHLGQAVRALGGTLEYFIDTVFNFPTLAECYKVAALDGLNRVNYARRVGCRSRSTSGTAAACSLEESRNVESAV